MASKQAKVTDTSPPTSASMASTTENHRSPYFSSSPSSKDTNSHTTNPDKAANKMCLPEMSPTEREAFYKQHFGNKVEPLKCLQSPELVHEFPKFGAEIIAAYLQHTIFTVKVWINYDAAADRFYFDNRAQDCGKLRLSERHINFDTKVQEFGKIRFEIGTPFTEILTATIFAAPSLAEEGVQITASKMKGLSTSTPVFREGWQGIAHKIKTEFRATGKAGLNFDDITELGKLFIVLPGPEEYTDAGWLRDARFWMNIERECERNGGHVDGLNREGWNRKL